MQDKELFGYYNPWNWNKHHKQLFKQLKNEVLSVKWEWAMEESFAHFWEYSYQKSVLKYFKNWYFWATPSRLKPMSYTAKKIIKCCENIISYLTQRITDGTAEELNSKIQ